MFTVPPEVFDTLLDAKLSEIIGYLKLAYTFGPLRMIAGILGNIIALLHLAEEYLINEVFACKNCVTLSNITTFDIFLQGGKDTFC